MTQERFKELLRSQQGELNAVLMYQRLAKVVKTDKERETFLQLAKEEGRHASVFHAYTKEALKPKKTMAIIMPFLYRLLGKKRLYKLIAKGEYDAAVGYEHLIADFPEVESVKNDEKRHGDMVGYYSRDDVKTVLMRHQRYLLINIANEWGEHHVTTQHWQDCYQAAVAEMRKAGFKTTLVIDAPGWGQNIQPILEGGRQLIEKDPLHNILFSVHMYGSWNNAQDIIDKLTAAKEQNLPLIVGEFGYNYENGNNNLKCKADHRTIMKTCKQLGYGFMPWSWTGNNKENAWLDIVDHRDWKTPTSWGNEVIEGEYGIRQTAVTANVFAEDYKK